MLLQANKYVRFIFSDILNNFTAARKSSFLSSWFYLYVADRSSLRGVKGILSDKITITKTFVKAFLFFYVLKTFLQSVFFSQNNSISSIQDSSDSSIRAFRERHRTRAPRQRRAANRRARTHWSRMRRRKFLNTKRKETHLNGIAPNLAKLKSGSDTLFETCSRIWKRRKMK